MQTDGINFPGIWAHSDLIDVDNITTNDVGSTLRMYGVEAARATLMREVRAVFGAYGIGVDPRHLGLIADFMTHMVRDNLLWETCTKESPTEQTCITTHAEMLRVHMLPKCLGPASWCHKVVRVWF